MTATETIDNNSMTARGIRPGDFLMLAADTAPIARAFEEGFKNNGRFSS